MSRLGRELSVHFSTQHSLAQVLSLLGRLPEARSSSFRRCPRRLAHRQPPGAAREIRARMAAQGSGPRAFRELRRACRDGSVLKSQDREQTKTFQEDTKDTKISGQSAGGRPSEGSGEGPKANAAQLAGEDTQEPSRQRWSQDPRPITTALRAEDGTETVMESIRAWLALVSTSMLRWICGAGSARAFGSRLGSTDAFLSSRVGPCPRLGSSMGLTTYLRVLRVLPVMLLVLSLTRPCRVALDHAVGLPIRWPHLCLRVLQRCFLFCRAKTKRPPRVA
jgi:hypothetical protein